jgi:uncharacterized protein YbjT (DUF2867 family)
MSFYKARRDGICGIITFYLSVSRMQSVSRNRFGKKLRRAKSVHTLASNCYGADFHRARQREEKMKVLMVGASGKYAGLVLPELKKRGVTVRALIRAEEQAKDVTEKGAAEVAIGDLGNELSLIKAAEGVEGVFHINPAFAPNEADLGVSMVRAAKQAGARKFVFSGVIHPSISKMNNHAAKRPVEEALYESGLVFTVLQPAMFMQTLLNGWKEVTERNTFSLPYSKKAKACYVDYRDVAEAAAIAFTTTRLDYGSFELCSAGMVDRIELTELMSRALGRPIQAGEPSFDQWQQTAQIPAGPVRDGLRKMYDDYNQFGFPGGNPLVLRAILDREPRTLSSFFAELAAGSAGQSKSAA